MEPIVIIEEVERMVEDRARERWFAKGEESGRRAVLEASREAVADLAEAYGVPLDEQRRAWIGGASLAELDAVRAALKRSRNWPSSEP